MKVTLIVPTLNEIDGMRQIMPLIKREWYDQLIIIDGGSTDGTIEYAAENGYFVLVQKEQKKRGILEGYEMAHQAATGDVIILFSPDGNSVADMIPRLVSKMKEGYDMVIVSRYLDSAKSYDDDILTGFGNWMFTALANLFFKADYTDSLVMFRAYKKDVIKQLGIDELRSALWEWLVGRRVGWEQLLSIRAAKHRLKTAEVPGDEPSRLGGERKMKPFRCGLAMLIQIFRELIVRN